MSKIKCVKTESGGYIPIHNILFISGPKYSHYVHVGMENEGIGYRLSDEDYNKLLKELNIL